MDNVVHCAKCGQVIPAERVEAIPGVEHCVACQSGVEHASPPPPPSYSGEFCPQCHKKGIDAPLVWRHPRDSAVLGEFLSCSQYPSCLYSDRDSMRNLVCSDHEKASPGQVAWLVKHGMSKPDAKALSAKAAAKQIDQHKANKRGKSSSPSGRKPGCSYDVAGGNPGGVPSGDSESRLPWPALPQGIQREPALPVAGHSQKTGGVAYRTEVEVQPGQPDNPSQMTATDRLHAVKNAHPHAYDKWTPAEEAVLCLAHQQGQSIKEIAALLQRKAGGIRSRLVKLGLVEKMPPKNPK